MNIEQWGPRWPRLRGMSRPVARRTSTTCARESARFRDVLAGVRTRSTRTHVPRLGHLRPARRTWPGAGLLGDDRAHPAPRPVDREAPEPERPASYDALLAWFDDSHAALRRRAGGGRPGRRGVDLVERADGRLHVPPPGARGADPPARRRARRRHGDAAGPGAGRRRGRGGARRDVRRHARRGASSSRSPTTCASTAPTPATPPGCSSGTLRRHRPRPGRPTTRTTSASSPTPAPSPTPWWRARPAPSTPGCGAAATTARSDVHGDRDVYARFRLAVDQPID